MSTPAVNFVAVCGNANLPLNGTKATFLKALKESGASIGPSLTSADLKERFGALTWVRHAVANSIDPVTWPALLSTPLLDVLRSLYPIPQPRPDASAGETDLHRVAHMVSLFLPFPTGWSLCRHRPCYSCSADDPGRRYRHVAPGGPFPCSGDRTYGGSSIHHAAPFRFRPDWEEALADA